MLLRRPWSLGQVLMIVLALVVLMSLGISWRLVRPGVQAREDRLIPASAARSITKQPADPPATAAPMPPLPESQRQYIWQVEHYGLLLGKVGFQPLADALKVDDAGRLAALLAGDFQGEVPSHPRRVRLDSEAATVEREQDDGQPPTVLGRDPFVARLLAYRRLFRHRPQVKVSLMSLGSEHRPALEGFWRGTCLMRLWGEAAEGKPLEITLTLSYRLPRPDESEYAQGGWLKACRVEQSQVARAQRYLMKEVAEARGFQPGQLHDNWLTPGLTPWSVTGGVYLCDYDRDGRIDVLITDVRGFLLYHGLESGRFQEVTGPAGLPRRGPSPLMSTAPTAAFADLDGDGWEDLVLDVSVYRNLQGQRFERIPPSRTSLQLPAANAAITLADYDRDGRIDIYVARSNLSKADSWLEGRTSNPQTNQLWHNEGDWQFRNVTGESGTDGGGRSVFTALWLDVNDDRWPDLFVPNEFGNGQLLINRQDGTFQAQALTQGPCDFGTMGATCGDVDNDGRIDIFAANMYSKAGSRIIGNLAQGTYPEPILAKMRRFVTGSQLHHTLGHLKIEQLGQKYQIAAVGWSFGAALADLDNDGWLDLFATCGYISQDRSKPDG
jgi:hypothetical protein